VQESTGLCFQLQIPYFWQVSRSRTEMTSVQALQANRRAQTFTSYNWAEGMVGYAYSNEFSKTLA